MHEDDSVSLPEDIIFDVLVRLPVKSLCRFRCVSRAWRALICDQAFIAAQRSRAGPHLVGVFFGASSAWPPDQVRVVDMEGNVVKVFEVRPPGNDDISGVLRQQASTQLNVIVEHPIHVTAMIIDPAAGRACTVETYSPQMMLSFGRASPSGALKILCLEETVPNQQICMVGTIMDGGAEPLRWRTLGLAPPFVTRCRDPERRATANGVVYFLPPPSNDYAAVAFSGSHRIAAFDLESEHWKMINGPPLQNEYGVQYFTLTEYKGTLGFVQFIRMRNDDQHYYITIWLLVDFDKNVWVKDCTIQVPKTWILLRVLGPLDDGRILLLVSEVRHDKTRYHRVLIFYNLDTKMFTKLMDIAITFGDILVMYTGSLLSCS